MAVAFPLMFLVAIQQAGSFCCERGIANNLTRENLGLLDQFQRLVIASKILSQLGIEGNRTQDIATDPPEVHPEIMSQIRAITQEGHHDSSTFRHLYVHSEEDMHVKHQYGICTVTLDFAVALPEPDPIDNATILIPLTICQALVAPRFLEITLPGTSVTRRLPLRCNGSAYDTVVIDNLVQSEEVRAHASGFTLQIKLRFLSNATDHVVRRIRANKAVLHLKYRKAHGADVGRNRRELVSRPTAGATTGADRLAQDDTSGICERMWDQQLLETLEQTDGSIQNDILPCCRRSLEVDFDRIGWGDWIISPKKFQTSYCIGRCANYGTFSNMAYTLYVEIMQAYPRVVGMGKTPCCTPVAFSGLTVAVRQGPNEETIQTLNNIIVDSCGCL